MNSAPSVCLIDDDEIYQFTMTRTLKKRNFAQEIISFPNGEKALFFFKENYSQVEILPDIIFLDINMPIMDGWQFIDQYVKLKPEIGKKIIVYMVSSSIDERDLTRAKQISEISDYIIKPVSISDLEKIFNKTQLN